MQEQEKDDKEKTSVIGHEFDEFLAPTKRSKALTWSLWLRVGGFLLLAMALVVMVLWQRGQINPLYQKASFGMAIAGIIIYFSGRIMAFMEIRKRSNRNV
ncbi:MAG: hypothetical protein A2268_04040 [Candidatus Raymondbacteria bacterium RifOxyA12_full_50_37]|uniref:Uncharacterized protein n=1 Tax=Candidatus Raymondbacteria bacterium RIFOXYD12_FULL_49_13 TaxID=1817890 RepID=A0A1F7FAM8_UNCRA|nr:MAG: hypothetical protein A2268_04040 [Candidatus Raymondbacteria bacterium RifOxyA12_full_50_37]OGJ92604.1 MAG: hypothetical protein A2248_05910 [Candidatus Raymondbacteria bacterium RIFOXYA2_FULL_49_16]OGJ97958.1 MAG: hypothetical protein A2453_02935 [Candidatus Raymondbacteria bacterium RIFOXYC2_FULL_50_21]OGJ98613.1 MAG: hypothetical protein A2487_05550 [Candidatus Raymondbacteria bacterium RifOxyC12_full_50_8]OGK01994.1 MAG: hypothetical protein A2350_21145 [Candidatus Raymondbacteria b